MKKVAFQTSKSSMLNSDTTALEPHLKNRSVKDATFKLDLTPSPEDLINKAESKYINHINNSNNGILIDKTKTFDNFIVGPSNNMAFVTMQAVSLEPSRPNSPGR